MATSSRKKAGGNNQQPKKETTAKSDNQAAPASKPNTTNGGTAEQSGNPDLTVNQDVTSSDAKKEKTGKIPGLSVRSKQAGFRRAGRAWTTEPTFIALEGLTDEERTALEEEPMLVVVPAEL